MRLLSKAHGFSSPAPPMVLHGSSIATDGCAFEEAYSAAPQPGPTQCLATKMSLDITIREEIDSNIAKTNSEDLIDTQNCSMNSSWS